MRVVVLVLLPGMDGTCQLLSEFVTALGPEVQTAVVSYPPAEALDYAQLEALVRAQLPSDRPFVLLGESFSGPIAVSIAASSPSGLRGLLLCCSFVRNPRPEFGVFKALTGIVPVGAVPTAFLCRALLGRFSSPPIRRAVAQILSRVSPRVLRARIHSVLGVDVASLLSRVRVPVLYLRATEDRVVPRAASQLILRRLPEARVVEIEAPHFLLQVAPDEAARQVRGFMHEVAVRL